MSVHCQVLTNVCPLAFQGLPLESYSQGGYLFQLVFEAVADDQDN